MIRIRVLDSNTGRPKPNIKVAIHFNGVTRHGTRRDYTDSEGYARFDTDPSSNAEVFIGPNSVHLGSISASMEFFT